MTAGRDRALPSNLDAERLILGALMLQNEHFGVVAGVLTRDDFTTEKHQLIFSRMSEVYESGEKVDRVTVANALMGAGQLEAVGGMSGVVDLDTGLPPIVNLDSYVRIVQEKATLRRAIFACQSVVDRCMVAEDSSEDILQYAESVLAKLSNGPGKHGQWLRPGEVMEGFPGGAGAFLSRPRGGAGIPTPWAPITAKLCGLHKGELVVIAGRPSMGKSIVAMQLAHHAAKEGHGVAVLSLEMSKESLISRLICAVGSVDAQRFREGKLDAEERRRAQRAANDIHSLPLWIDDTRASTMPAISAALRKLRAKNDVSMFVVDHLQLMRGGRHDQKRNEEMSEISHGMKHIAREMDMVGVALSQLNRKCEDENRRPQQSDLAETGSLEQDADVLMFVHRPERYAKNHGREELRGMAEFILAKQREGPVGIKEMVFLKEYQRFEVSANDREVYE
jgi:replicative DNA helicase